MIRGFRNNIYWAISFILVLCLLASCRVNRPDNVLPPRKMEQFLYDYHLAQSMALDLPSNERYKRELYFNYVFQKHGISKQDFERSLVWYTRYPHEFSKVYDRLNKKAEKERLNAAKEVEKIEKKSYSTLSGDSVDLWYLNKTRIFTMSPALNKLTFTIPADTSFRQCDTLTWNTRATFLGNNTDSVKPSVYLSLTLHYKDSISTVDTLFTHSGESSLEIVTDSTQKLSRVSGAINYVNRTQNNSLFLLIDKVSLMRCNMRPR